MAAVLVEQRPQQPRSEQNTPAAFLLALAMHALLVGALWISVQWRTEPAGAVVVELWSGAPPPEPIVVAPPPPPPPAPARQEPEPERPDADIVTKKDEKKKAPPKAEPLPDPKKVEADRRRAEAEKQRLEAEKKQLELERRKQAEAAERKREDERRDAVRKAEQARMLAQAGGGATGGPPAGSPGAAPSSGVRGDPGYAGVIAAHIKPRIVFSVPEGTSPSIYADFEVDLLPTGEILAVRLVKPSGLPGYDAAVERAIRRSDPFPRKADGTVERTVKLIFRPVEK